MAEFGNVDSEFSFGSKDDAAGTGREACNPHNASPRSLPARRAPGGRGAFIERRRVSISLSPITAAAERQPAIPLLADRSLSGLPRFAAMQDALKAKNAAAKKGGGATRATAVRAKAGGARPARATAATAKAVPARAAPVKAAAAKAVAAAPAPAPAPKPSNSDNVADLLSSMGAVSSCFLSPLLPHFTALARAG